MEHADRARHSEMGCSGDSGSGLGCASAVQGCGAAAPIARCCGVGGRIGGRLWGSADTDTSPAVVCAGTIGSPSRVDSATGVCVWDGERYAATRGRMWWAAICGVRITIDLEGKRVVRLDATADAPPPTGIEYRRVGDWR